jgi:hypothetical protein
MLFVLAIRREAARANGQLIVNNAPRLGNCVCVFTSETRVPHKQLAFVTCALEKSTPFAQNLATLYQQDQSLG